MKTSSYVFFSFVLQTGKLILISHVDDILIIWRNCTKVWFSSNPSATGVAFVQFRRSFVSAPMWEIFDLSRNNTDRNAWWIRSRTEGLRVRAGVARMRVDGEWWCWGWTRAFLSSFIHLFVRSFIHSFIHSFNQSFIHSFNQSFVHSFILSFIRPLIHSFVRSLS